MARALDTRAEQARELFLSGKKLIEIAQLLDIPEGTIRSWKNRYKWNRNVANKKTQTLRNAEEASLETVMPQAAEEERLR